MTENLADVNSIYAEDPKLKKEDVDRISKWLETQPHLPIIEELQVILFLHSCYYDDEAAKKTIENYFSFRTHSNLFISGGEEITRRVLSSFFIAFLPKRTPDGAAILFMKLLDRRPEKYNCVEHTKVSFMVTCLYFHQFGPANGLIVIYDMQGVSLGHLFKLNLTAMKQLAYFYQEAAPMRVKGIHYLNVVPITQHMVSLVKPFLKKEIYDMMKFHSNSLGTLHKHIPEECLPQEYGGKLPPVSELHEKNIENLINNFDFLEWHDAQKVDETKRVTKSRKGLFGSLQGFFRSY